MVRKTRQQQKQNRKEDAQYNDNMPYPFQQFMNKWRRDINAKNIKGVSKQTEITRLRKKLQELCALCLKNKMLEKVVLSDLEGMTNLQQILKYKPNTQMLNERFLDLLNFEKLLVSDDFNNIPLRSLDEINALQLQLVQDIVVTPPIASHSSEQVDIYGAKIDG